MTTKGEDVSFLEEAAREVEAYLFSEQLYWPLDTGERMTIASVQLAMKRLSASADSPGDRNKFDEARDRINSLRDQWRTNWSKKAEKEYGARLRQWDHVVDELSSQGTRRSVNYGFEVRWRVMLEILKDEILELPLHEQAQLEKLDLRLSAFLKPGDFVWEDDLKSEFSKDRYWFLYGQPATGES